MSKTQEVSPEIQKWAREHILEIKHMRACKLSLCNCGLTALPREVLELDWLEEIRLDGNLLRELPKELELFNSLSRINIIDNPIENIPNINGLVIDSEQMVRLAVPKSKIVGLQFYGHNCASIMDYSNQHWSDMPNLRELYLKDSHLITWPDSIFRIKRLEILSINKCYVTEIPNEIFSLEHLRMLDLKFNSIESIPDFLCKMHNLMRVNLEGNCITAPDDIDKSLPCFECLYNGKWVAKLIRKQSVANDNGQRQEPQPKLVQHHHLETLSSCRTTSSKYHKDEEKMSELKYDAFISHASSDKSSILQIINYFKQNGVKYWVDHEQITFGDRITEKIEEGLQQSKHVIVCLSSNLGRSNWCRAEYGPILHRSFNKIDKKKTIPLRLDSCTDYEIPLLLYDINRVDYSDKIRFNELLEFLKQ